MKMKDKITCLKETHTFALCILIAFLYLIILKGVKWVGAYEITPNGYVLQLIAECVGVALSLLIMDLVGKKYIIREKGEGIMKGLFIGGFLVGICLLLIVSALKGVFYNKGANELLPLPQIAIFVATMAGIGIAEEFIFRGVILNLLIDRFEKTTKGIYASIAVSSIIFGLAHISNIISGVSIKSSLIQAVGAMVLGVLLSAIYLRTKNIWVVAILHAFMDFSSLIGSGLFGTNSLAGVINNYDNSYIKFIGYFIYLVPVLILLRKKKLSEILEFNKTF